MYSESVRLVVSYNATDLTGHMHRLFTTDHSCSCHISRVPTRSQSFVIHHFSNQKFRFWSTVVLLQKKIFYVKLS